jgi:hypothetical protein
MMAALEGELSASRSAHQLDVERFTTGSLMSSHSPAGRRKDESREDNGLGGSTMAAKNPPLRAIGS